MYKITITSVDDAGNLCYAYYEELSTKERRCGK